VATVTPLPVAGIDEEWEDIRGERRRVTPEVLAAVRALYERGRAAATPTGSPGARGPLVVYGVRSDPGAVRTLGRWRLVLEGGGEVAGEGPLPPAAHLPTGYHRLCDDAGEVVVAVCPPACRRPNGRSWGVSAQLYAARTTASWGHGDLGDLRVAGRELARLGARRVLVNPLGAATPGPTVADSPYLPSSRCWLHPIYLRVEDVPGAEALADQLAPLAAAGRALGASRRIDRTAVWVLKRDALRRLWRRWNETRTDQSPSGEHFARWRRSQGSDLERFCAFQALSECMPGPWPGWPEPYRTPDSPAVRRFVAERNDEVAFHAWLQWLLDRQLAEASRALPPVLDLPVGVAPEGADVWAWPGVFVAGARIGAPPDPFNEDGQEWGMPPPHPEGLRAAGFGPFLAALRATMRHGAGVRLDHVMGLFRLWWIPEGAVPTDGAYVRYPWPELLDLVALESQRAGAFVVGEDLGLVEDGVRAELADRWVLSTRVLLFEEGPPESWPERSVALVSTHDLPTIVGLLSGQDRLDQEAAGVPVDPEAEARVVARVRDLAAETRGFAGLSEAKTDRGGDRGGPAKPVGGPGTSAGPESAGPESADGLGRGESGDRGFGPAAPLLGEPAPGEPAPGEPAPSDEDELVVAAIFGRLASAGSLECFVSLDDLCGVRERPNMPGTIDTWPNWRIGLPGPLEDLLRRSRLRRLVSVLTAHRPDGHEVPDDTEEADADQSRLDRGQMTGGGDVSNGTGGDLSAVDGSPASPRPQSP
jgi:4-alpha-glucanotransferase